MKFSNNFTCFNPANSIGNLFKTSLLKPFTINAIAFFCINSFFTVEIWSHSILEVVASCSNCAVGSLISMYGKVCVPHSFPIKRESHCEKFLAPLQKALL